LDAVLSRYPDFAAVLAAGEDEAASKQTSRRLGGRDLLDRREGNRGLAPKWTKPAESALSP